MTHVLNGGAGNLLVKFASLRRPSRLLVATLSILTALLCGSPALAAAAEASPPEVTLEAIGANPEGISATADTPITLSAVKKVGTEGAAGHVVTWKVSPADKATLSRDRSLTADGKDKAAGTADTIFTPHGSGRYVVTASTQSNPGCVGENCATFVDAEFVFDVAAIAESDGRAGKSSRGVWAAVGGTAAALALVASNRGSESDDPDVLSLAKVSGDLQTGPANSGLSNPLIVRADNDGQAAPGVTILWSASGGATVTPVSNTTDSSGHAQVTVTNVGPGPGPVTVTAVRSDNPSASVSFTITVLTPSLVKISGDGQSAPTDTQVPNPLVVEARLGPTPVAGIGITWTVLSGDATIASVSNGGNTNGSGQSSAVIDFGSTPGPVVVKASRNDIPSLFQTFMLTSTLTRSLAIVSGDNQTAPPNTALPSPLVVHATNNGNNIAGVTINWMATGGATLSSASSVTDGFGQAQVSVTSVGPGPDPFTVIATRADEPSAMVVFNENIDPPVLSILSGDNQSGMTGSPAQNPIVVLLVDGGGSPVVSETITWTVTNGSADVTSSTSVTNGSGHAQMTFTYGSSPGPVTIQASAYGGDNTVDFSATTQTASSLLKTSGDGQAGNPGAVLAPFVVTVVPPAGVTELSGVPITFTITSLIGGSLSTTSTVTNASGQAQTTLTLGFTPGTVTVDVQAAGGPTETFTATVNGSLVGTTLTIVSGNSQTLSTGVASQPMIVELKDGGTPLVGLTVTWQTDNGTVSSSSGVTNGSGQASTTVTPNAAGPVVVTANFAAFNQYTASTVSFTHNTTLGSLTNLTTDEAAVAVALDNACGELEGSASTPEEQDLLDQCEALADASGSNPGAVANAIEEMLPDVAQTQNQTGQAAVNAQFDNLKGRIATLRAGNFGSSFGGLALTTSTGSIPLGGIASMLLGEDDAKKQEDNFQRWGFFASGNIGRGNSDANDTSPKYDFDVKGLTVGVDYRKTDKLILGVALGYTKQDTTLAGGEGSLDMHGFSLSGYSTYYQDNSWYMDGVVTIGRNDYDHSRRIVYTLPGMTVDQMARASAGGTDTSASLTVGRDFNHKGWNYGLYGRAQYSVQRFDAFEEELDSALAGSGLALRIDDRTVKSLSSVFGGKASYTHSTDWGVLAPQFGLEWQREYSGDPESFNAFLVSDPTGTPILITGDALDDSYFRMSFGLSMILTRGRSGFIQYDRMFGRNGMSHDNLAIGIRIEF